MKKLNILVIPSWYPNKSDPLWGNYFIKQTEALSSYADTSMLYINRASVKEPLNYFNEKSTDGYYDNKYPFKFYKKTILNFRSVSLDYSYKKYAKDAYKAYKNLELFTGKPDVIIAMSALPAGLAAKYISEKENIPYIVHAHSEGIMINPLYKDYVTTIIKGAADYMAVNESIKKIVESKRNNCHLVPNFIDCNKFKIGKKDSKDFILISVSNFYKVKALDVLLKAMDIVVNKKGNKNIKLKIVGTGEYKDFYEGIARSLNLMDNVEFVGYVDNDKLPELLSKSNALCVSSTFETFCIPIVEAFASGIPVITTDCVGPLEIVNKDNAIVTPINDIDKYADSILKMVKNYKKYNSKKIKDYAFNKYDKSVVCKNIIDICSNLK